MSTHASLTAVGSGAPDIVMGRLQWGIHASAFETTPLVPKPVRYWDAMVERHKITQFYTAPTAIRALAMYMAKSQ